MTRTHNISHLIRIGMLIGCCFIGHIGWGQQSFDVTVNKNPVHTGGNVQLKLSLKNFRSSIDAPKIAGLHILGGPTTSQNSSWVNGVSSSELTYTFTYRVQSIKDIAIPPMSITAGQVVLKSKGFTLKVSKENATKPSTQSKEGLGDLACVIEVSNRDVVIGEPLVASFKIYKKASNLDVREYVIPEMLGFWKEAVDQPDPNWEPQVIRGQRYNVANLRTVVLFPQQTGKLTLTGFELTGYMRTSFFNGRNVEAKAKPVTIQVRPLPDPVPSNYIGAFKRLDAKVKVSATEAITNEAITVEIIYNGQGNLKFIQEPILQWPRDFEVFDPEVKDRINVSANGQAGSRTFRYVVIPRSPGIYTIPTLNANWYHTKTKKYVSLNAGGQSLTIQRDSGTPESSMSYNSKTDIQVLNQDIRYIQTEPGQFHKRAKFELRNIMAMGALGMGPLIFLMALAWRRRQEGHERDLTGYKQKRAHASLRSEFRQAKSLLNQPEAFYPALGQALEAYLCAKLRWSTGQFQRDAVKTALIRHTPELSLEWDRLLEQMEMARFAPGSLPAPDALLDQSVTLVNQTEKSWKI